MLFPSLRVFSRCLSRPLGAIRMMSSVSINRAANGDPAAHTPSALLKWSVGDRTELPSVESIRQLHVYDFDNTLFCSPTPNRQLWNGVDIGRLQNSNVFTGGGWWHDPSVLAKTGKGLDVEEPRAWEGWWNEHIVSLVQLSMQQRDALCVLLTGRGDLRFGDLIKRIVASRKLDFDMVCLKPAVGVDGQEYSSTMKFKQAFLAELSSTYYEADELRIYEDRPKHVQGFKEFLSGYDSTNFTTSAASQRTKSLSSEVVAVAERTTSLDHDVEIAEVQRMINVNNEDIRCGAAPAGARPWRIKKVVYYSGYLLEPEASDRLLEAVSMPFRSDPTGEIRTLGNSIVITPRSLNSSMLERVGGRGKKVRWRVTGIGEFDNKIWAARVAPVPETEKIYTENPTPCIVLALRSSARPRDASYIREWQPLPDGVVLEFDTTVNEKAMLHLDDERNGTVGSENSQPRLPKRDNFSAPHHKNNQGTRNFSSGGHGGRGRSGGRFDGRGGHGRGGRHGGGHRSGHHNKGRGRGGQPPYRSLDETNPGARGKQPAAGNGGGTMELSY